ncbi:MAG: RNA methyltransferase [Cyclobacteriaceae bacterium]
MSTNNLENEYFGIGIQNGKTPENLGVLWRSAQNMGASFIFTIGKRYERQACDVYHAANSMPYFHYPNFAEFYNNLPKGARLVGIEITSDAVQLPTFHHPKRCVYLLGAEDHGLTKEAVENSHHLVRFESAHSLNVAVAGSIIMYDRTLQKPRS